MFKHVMIEGREVVLRSEHDSPDLVSGWAHGMVEELATKLRIESMLCA